VDIKEDDTMARTTRSAPKAKARRVEDSVDAYIGRQSADVQRVLTRIRGIVRKALPNAEETISYQIPTYKIDGRSVVYFAGWKQHWSLYPVDDRVRAALGADLDGYEFSKGTLRFPLADAIPEKLIARVVRELGRSATSRPR
jgi:uncharacterized protein YdhG (YjbR/CyaY superfamily)